MDIAQFLAACGMPASLTERPASLVAAKTEIIAHASLHFERIPFSTTTVPDAFRNERGAVDPSKLAELLNSMVSPTASVFPCFGVISLREGLQAVRRAKVHTNDDALAIFLLMAGAGPDPLAVFTKTPYHLFERLLDRTQTINELRWDPKFGDFFNGIGEFRFPVRAINSAQQGMSLSGALRGPFKDRATNGPFKKATNLIIALCGAIPHPDFFNQQHWCICDRAGELDIIRRYKDTKLRKYFHQQSDRIIFPMEDYVVSLENGIDFREARETREKVRAKSQSGTSFGPYAVELLAKAGHISTEPERLFSVDFGIPMNPNTHSREGLVYEPVTALHHIRPSDIDLAVKALIKKLPPVSLIDRKTRMELSAARQLHLVKTREADNDEGDLEQSDVETCNMSSPAKRGIDEHRWAPCDENTEDSDQENDREVLRVPYTGQMDIPQSVRGPLVKRPRIVGEESPKKPMQLEIEDIAPKGTATQRLSDDVVEQLVRAAVPAAIIRHGKEYYDDGVEPFREPFWEIGSDGRGRWKEPPLMFGHLPHELAESDRKALEMTTDRDVALQTSYYHINMAYFKFLNACSFQQISSGMLEEDRVMADNWSETSFLKYMHDEVFGNRFEREYRSGVRALCFFMRPNENRRHAHRAPDLVCMVCPLCPKTILVSTGQRTSARHCPRTALDHFGRHFFSSHANTRMSLYERVKKLGQ